MPPRIDTGMDPIMQQHRENMQVTMEALTRCFPGVGLCLFLFDQQAGQPRANYISNTDRKRTVEAVREWVARQDAATMADAVARAAAKPDSQPGGAGA